MLRPRALNFKTYFNVSSDSFINTTSQARTIYAPPILTVTAGRRIFTAATGYMTYRTGEWNLGEWGRGVGQGMDKSSLALGIAGQGKRKNYSAEIQVSVSSFRQKIETNQILTYYCDYSFLGQQTNIDWHCGISLGS